MRILCVKGIKDLAHQNQKKIGTDSIVALEQFVRDTVNLWCENATKQKRRVLMKNTCPIDKIRSEALNYAGK